MCRAPELTTSPSARCHCRQTLLADKPQCCMVLCACGTVLLTCSQEQCPLLQQLCTVVLLTSCSKSPPMQQEQQLAVTLLHLLLTPRLATPAAYGAGY